MCSDIGLFGALKVQYKSHQAIKTCAVYEMLQVFYSIVLCLLYLWPTTVYHTPGSSSLQTLSYKLHIYPGS